MSFAKKVIIAVGISDEASQMYEQVKSMHFLSNSEIHFVHVFNTIKYSGLFLEFPLIYPFEADHKSIHDSIVTLLNNISKNCLPENYSGKLIFKCLFDQNPKHEFSNYVRELQPDLVIMATRKKHSIFESSFAQYVNRHTESNVLLLKN